MNILPRDEMIDCESWYSLADYHYTGQYNLPSAIVHCDMGSIGHFFDKIKNNSEKYVVISARSDFGLHYQNQFPPYLDYSKAANTFITPQNSNFGYNDITIPARINKDKCNPTHRYSVKCYSFTDHTFDEIPHNVVKWFVTNNTIHDDDRIVTIPFGINGVDGNKEPGNLIYSRAKYEFDKYRDKNLYINFQFYTNERARLFHLYQNEKFATLERNVPFYNYVNGLLTHNCCLCPSGNGWDCYRTLECLYLGCIPILEINLGTIFYNKLDVPICFMQNLESLRDFDYDEQLRNSHVNDRSKWNLEKVSLSYWKKQIDKYGKTL